MKTLSKKGIILSLVILILILLAGICYFIFYKNVPKPKPFSETAASAEVISDFNSNNFDQAISTTAEYLQKNPDDVSGELLLAASYVQKGSLQFTEKENSDKALDIVNKVLSTDPNNSEAYRIKGYAYEIVQDYPNAFLAYNKAISLNENSAEAYSNRGHAYMLYGDAVNAEADYESALRIDSNLDDALINLGSLYITQAKYKDAISLLTQALGVTQNTHLKASAEQLLGVIYNATGDSGSAKIHLENSVSIDPNIASAWVELARANYFLLAETKDQTEFSDGLDKTLNYVVTALKINPNQTSAYFLNGVIFSSLDDSENAKKMFDIASSVVDKDITLDKTSKDIIKEQIKTELAKLK